MFNEQELKEKAASVYAEAEQHYKGSEINSDTLMRVAQEYFDFNEDQLNQLGGYFEWEEIAFMNLDDVDTTKLKYIDPKEIEELKADKEDSTSEISRIEQFLLSREGFETDEADSILTQLHSVFKGLTKTEESLEENVEVKEESLPSNDELPDICYVYIESENRVGIVKKGEVGYYPATNIDPNLTEPEQLKAFVNERNAILDIDERTMEIMKTKSMFGWGDKKEEGIVDTLSDSDKFKIDGLDKIISKVQSQFNVQVIGSYTDNSMILELKGGVLALIDAIDYIKSQLAAMSDIVDFTMSDKENDKVVIEIKQK